MVKKLNKSRITPSGRSANGGNFQSEKKHAMNREEIYEVISRNWPIHITEIAGKMDLLTSNVDERKLVITHLKYHVDQLARHDRIKVKKIGKAVVVWPIEIEKLRMVHEMLKGI